MKKILSFTINHDTLERGLYVSRIDGDVITYDIRMKKPNGGDYLENPAMHTIEHIFATYARNSAYSDSVVYFGPMGCRTGFYILLAGDLTPLDIFPLVQEMCDFILAYEGEIPGASARDCGNYQDLNPDMAKYYIRKYKTEVLEHFTEERYTYPQ